MHKLQENTCRRALPFGRYVDSAAVQRRPSPISTTVSFEGKPRQWLKAGARLLAFTLVEGQCCASGERFRLLETASLLMSCRRVTKKTFCARKVPRIAAIASSVLGAVPALSRLVTSE